MFCFHLASPFSLSSSRNDHNLHTKALNYRHNCVFPSKCFYAVWCVCWFFTAAVNGRVHARRTKNYGHVPGRAWWWHLGTVELIAGTVELPEKNKRKCKKSNQTNAILHNKRIEQQMKRTTEKQHKSVFTQG